MLLNTAFKRGIWILLVRPLFFSTKILVHSSLFIITAKTVDKLQLRTMYDDKIH